jgi:hypothetical protein
MHSAVLSLPEDLDLVSIDIVLDISRALLQKTLLSKAMEQAGSILV